ncbi:carboxylating nicotinate-nucleotide diphosphorylase [Salinisphaera hydrothermalis]|uniref:Probable nicotinate-nucleotide pyrophosphorylase [carboxylating] n=1 Tax=Salinisphaera hydrothermalis (strain C41B8) TaxID=1304275 RepID=A0A084IKD0_SALHC|nr:carboxylating nicotinate-nucleotide diphosphorylase [Salinisphaera hydrothermalis]KEZ77164.1 nicotinate-nucleotide pyrophosphorylase [Salinisphaera hydrothermalis C41B8]
MSQASNSIESAIETAIDLDRIDRWLAEDVRTGDVTTDAVLDASAPVAARWVAKAEGVVAGLAEAEAVFRRLDPALDWRAAVAEGEAVVAGTELVTFEGAGRAVLTGERTALNIAQRMSGIATATRGYVELIAEHPARILDTRKTVPGLRDLDKKAVAIGGGVNHRAGLYDLAMIKDNHIVAAGGITAAVAAVRAHAPDIGIEVETTTLDELDEALAAGVEMIMLDNMAPETMVLAVERTAGRARLEASGNVGRDNIVTIAATGVDFISIGALTHSVIAFDISQRIDRI